jgi:phosphatidylserine synthase
MIRWIPNILTLGNAACGFAGLMLLLLEGPDALIPATLMIFAGWLFDMVDGMTARALGVSGPFGAALDSLCDAITFGLLPGSLVLVTALQSGLPVWLGGVVGGGYLFATLLRLARFTAQEDHPMADGIRVFEGLSSPAAAMGVAAAVLVWPPIAPAVAVVAAPLMVSRLPYPDIGHVYLRRRLPAWHLLVPAALLLLLGPAATLALFFAAYFVAGPGLGRRFTKASPA